MQIENYIGVNKGVSVTFIGVNDYKLNFLESPPPVNFLSLTTSLICTPSTLGEPNIDTACRT